MELKIPSKIKFILSIWFILKMDVNKKEKYIKNYPWKHDGYKNEFPVNSRSLKIRF
jgi:hypothetical protein